MDKKLSKLMSLLLALTLVFSMATLTAWAEDEEDENYYDDEEYEYDYEEEYGVIDDFNILDYGEFMESTFEGYDTIRYVFDTNSNASRAKVVIYAENNSDMSVFIELRDEFGDLVDATDGESLNMLISGGDIDIGYNLDTDSTYFLYVQGTLTTEERNSEFNYQDDDIGVGVIPQNLAFYSAPKVSSRTYTGKNIYQTTRLSYCDFELIKGTDYTVTYSGIKNVGTATITYKAKAPYTGTKKLTFNINPKGVQFSGVKPGKKSFTATWSKLNGTLQKTITGFQIQYSTNKAFKSGNKLQSTTQKSASKVVIKKLKKKATYYVRIRTYTKVGKKTYYSSWSKVKAVKTK